MVWFFFFFPFSQYPFELGLVAAFVFSTLVCLSRLYTGMHTVLVRMSCAAPCPSCLHLCLPTAIPIPSHSSDARPALAVPPPGYRSHTTKFQAVHSKAAVRKPSGYCYLSPQGELFIPWGKRRRAWVEEPGEVGVAV